MLIVFDRNVGVDEHAKVGHLGGVQLALHSLEGRSGIVSTYDGGEDLVSPQTNPRAARAQILTDLSRDLVNDPPSCPSLARRENAKAALGDPKNPGLLTGASP